MNGWTRERRARQAELIRQWAPWSKSTGPRTEAGKLRVSRNGWRGGHRPRLRELSRMVASEIRAARQAVLMLRD